MLLREVLELRGAQSGLPKAGMARRLSSPVALPWRELLDVVLALFGYSSDEDNKVQPRECTEKA